MDTRIESGQDDDAMTALRALLTRSVTTLITLFGVAVIVFVVIRIAPGDPISMMLPPGASEADIDRLRAFYGLDKSIPQQFLIWLGSVLEGNFGTSISLRQNVLSIVLNRLPATLELSFLALVIASVLGTTLAFVATRWRETPAETGVDVASGIALSVPDFLWGLALILTFGVAFPFFEISGRVSPRLELPFATQFYLVESLIRFRFDITADLLKHMTMPALALALPFAAVIAQLLKASLKEAMAQDYVMLARTKGFSESRVIIRDALRNAILPTLDSHRRAVDLPDRRHGDRGAHLLLRRPRQSRDRRRHQPRPAADPGDRAALRGDLRLHQSRRRHPLRALEPAAASWLRLSFIDGALAPGA